jgi:integrase
MTTSSSDPTSCSSTSGCHGGVHQLATVVGFLAYTGLRWGEMAALRVDSFDMLRHRATVSEAVAEVRGRVVFDTPKGQSVGLFLFPGSLLRCSRRSWRVGPLRPSLHRRDRSCRSRSAGSGRGCSRRRSGVVRLPIRRSQPSLLVDRYAPVADRGRRPQPGSW